MIDEKRVEEIFNQCLFKDHEDISQQLMVNGVLHNATLNHERLQEARDEVKAILLQLPDPFMKSIGKGWSFLNMCIDKENNQWTDFHLRMEQLVMLGIGLDLVECLLPREMWEALPGCMPYYAVNDIWPN